MRTAREHTGDSSRPRLARGLGWLSVALGVPPLVAPDRMSQLIGVDDSEDARAALRLVGIRELMSAAGILARPRSSAWLWSRVAGDAMDLALLRRAFASAHRNKRGRITAAAAAVGGAAILDLVAGMRRYRDSRRTTGKGTLRASASITVNRQVAEVYGYWRDVQNLPRFMDHLESVWTTSVGRSHWVAKAPGGRTVEWDAEIVEDVPNQRIVWRSLEGADVDNRGRVTFAPAAARQGTEIRVELEYQPPGGAIGATIATLFGEEPAQQLRDDLRRFKQMIETGEIVRSDASLRGSRVQAQVHQRAAQPQA